MRTLLVVFVPPAGNLATGIPEIPEPAGIEALIA